MCLAIQYSVHAWLKNISVFLQYFYSLKLKKPTKKPVCLKLRLKFCCAWMSDFVSINQETHLVFSYGVLIFMNSTFATKLKNILLNH